MQQLLSVIDLSCRDGQPHFPQLELHRAQVFSGAQGFDGGKFFGVGGRTLPPGIAVTDLLFQQHAGDEKHAEASP